MTKAMKYVFRTLSETNYEGQVSFFSETQEEARVQAEEWGGDEVSIGDCVECWSVD